MGYGDFTDVHAAASRLAESAHAPLPPLDPLHAQLLRDFVAAEFDIFALIQNGSLDVNAAIAWNDDPTVREHLGALKRLLDDSLALHAAHSAPVAIRTLERIAATGETGTERRRAATEILRIARGRGATRISSPYGATSAVADCSDSMSGLDPSYEPDRMPTRQDTYAMDVPVQRGDADESHAAGTDAASDPPPIAAATVPEPVPTPDADLITLASLSTRLILNPDDEAALEDLFERLAPGASILNHPAPADLHDAYADYPFIPLANLTHITLHNAYLMRLEPCSAEIKLSFSHDDGPDSSIFLRLTRPDDAARWVIVDILERAP